MAMAIANGTEASAAGLSGLRAIAQKGKNGEKKRCRCRRGKSCDDGEICRVFSRVRIVSRKVSTNHAASFNHQIGAGAL